MTKLPWQQKLPDNSLQIVHSRNNRNNYIIYFQVPSRNSQYK